MKKILLIVCILILSVCYENSGYITKSCYKEEKANSLSDKTTYTFRFKEDVIDELSILYDYQDSDVNTIKSIKTSMEAEYKFLNIDHDVLNDESQHYKIKYYMDMNNHEHIDKFKLNISRTELVKNLKQDGFICE